MYTLRFFTISSFFAFITSLIIGILFISKGTDKNKINPIFGLACLSSALWAFGAYKFSLAIDYDAALFWWRIAHAGTILTPLFFIHFVCCLTKNFNKLLIALIYILAALFLSMNFFDKNFLYLEYSFNEFFFLRFKFDKNPIYLLFYITIYWLLLLGSFLLLLNHYKKTTGIQRNQLKYFIIGMITTWLAPEGMYLYIIFGLPLYPYSNVLIVFYPLILGYAILRYRLLDIKVAITRAGLFIFVYTLVLGLPFAASTYFKNQLIELFGPQWWMGPLILMAFLATVGPFIYIYLEKRAEDRLLKEQRKYQSTLKQASLGMTRIRNLDKLLNLIAHIVTKTVKISYVAVYLFNKDANEFVLHLSRDKGRIPVQKISSDNALITWIIHKNDPLIYEEVKRQFEDSGDYTFKHLEDTMQLLGAAVIIPSFLDNKFMGFFVLGDKMSGQIYTPEDLNVFQILASQAALAIENAQFYAEAKTMNEQISQAEKMATIGTMADGLSHQINNRFHALSLIAGDSIDTLKLTDTSKCTPEIQEMVKDINYALERIQANVKQGGEVVKGMLKYSRRGEEGFEALELNHILDSTLEMVQFKVKLSEIDLMRNFDKIPKIKGNLAQLEEAFFNFIDNANDAITERRTTFNEPGYRGKITISAKQVSDDVLEIIVEDNGIGVKDTDTKKVFTPFFTTKTSSRKGTGLGLYVIKRIITEMNKGKISFESAYKIGTRFILELPIAK